MAKKLTIWSESNGLVTKREVVDDRGETVTPMNTEKVTPYKEVLCWLCKGLGTLPDPFVKAGRIEESPCHQCDGAGKVVFHGGPRIDATFNNQSISLIRRYETRNGHTEITETPWDK